MYCVVIYINISPVQQLELSRSIYASASFVMISIVVWRQLKLSEVKLMLIVKHVTGIMSESDISASVKNGILYLEDPFDQVFAIS